MTQDDVLFGYRLQLFDLAARTTCRTRAGPSGCIARPITRWKRQVDRHGLEMLRPRERRRPQMPNQLPQMIEERIVSFAIAHPGLGPAAGRVELARPKWGAIVVSPNGVWKVLRRHGSEHARQATGADRRLRRALRAAARTGARAAHRRRPAGRAGRHRLLLRRAPDGHQRRDLAAHRDRHLLLLRVGRTRHLPRPTTRPPSRPARSRAASPASCKPPAGGWSACSPTTATSSAASPSAAASSASAPATAASTPDARRPTATSKRCTRRSSTSAGARPSRASSTRATPACAANSTPTSPTTTTTASTTADSHAGQIPADIVYGARKMEPR